MESAWKDKLHQQLIKQLGMKKGKNFAEKYLPALSMSYCEQHTIEEAIEDLSQIANLSLQNPLAIVFFESPRGEHPLHIKLYRYGSSIPLSDILPMIENMGLRTYTERPYKIAIEPNQFIWIGDFNVSYSYPNLLTLDQVKNNFNEALIKINVGLCENDGFNRLVLGAGLSWREIVVIRAYAKYMQQIGFRFSQQYIEKTISNHAPIAKKLIELFCLKFSLKQNTKIKNKRDELEQEIRADIDAITSLDEDHIIRFFWSLIKATLRTNYFQLGSDGNPKDYLSFKLNSAKVPDLPPDNPCMKFLSILHDLRAYIYAVQKWLVAVFAGPIDPRTFVQKFLVL